LLLDLLEGQRLCISLINIVLWSDFNALDLAVDSFKNEVYILEILLMLFALVLIFFFIICISIKKGK